MKKIIYRTILIAISGIVLFLAVEFVLTYFYTGAAKIVIDEKKYTNLQDIVNQPAFSKKILYVDIWGTRCTPCIAEMGNEKALNDKYKDNPQVEFLYLCSPYNYADDRLRWKWYINEFNLVGHHIFMNEACYFKVYNSIETNVKNRYLIPRYFVVKDGVVLLADAPPPSSKRISAIIDSLIKE